MFSKARICSGGPNIGLGDADGDADGDAKGEAVGVGAVLDIKTPLFQINFLPDLMHVNFFPEEIELAPNFEQVPPAFVALQAGVEKIDVNKMMELAAPTKRFIRKWYLS